MTDNSRSPRIRSIKSYDFSFFLFIFIYDFYFLLMLIHFSLITFVSYTLLQIPNTISHTWIFNYINGRHFLLINFKIQSLTVHLLLHKDFRYGWKGESLASIFSIWEVFSLPPSTTLNKNFQISNQKGLLLKLFFLLYFWESF